MSTLYKSSKDVPTEVLAARLNELADVVAQKHDRIGAEFTMRIPAECDRDADLVMSEAARRLSAAPAAQVEPVSAQVRYRRPEKGQPGWSVWQPAAIRLGRPSWEIDSQGWEVEYRLLYAAPQPAEQQSDVTQLVESLERFVSNPTPTSEDFDAARAALAAYRNQGGGT